MCQGEEGKDVGNVLGRGRMHVWGECVGEERMHDFAHVCMGEDELHTKRKKEGCEGEGGYMEPKPTILIELCFVNTPSSPDPFWDGVSPTTNSLPTACTLICPAHL